MYFPKIIEPWKKSDLYAKIHLGIDSGFGQLLVGLTGLPRAIMMAALFEDLKQPILVISPSTEEAKTIFSDLTALLSTKEVYFFPSLDLLPYEVYARNVEISQQRIQALTKLVRGEPIVVVATVDALLKKMAPKNIFKENLLTLNAGERFELLKLTKNLVTMGYNKEDLVEIPGTFSLRGGILDVFPFTEEHPIRIEFFDDEIESIRFFDVDHQRSLRETSQVFLPPADEFPVYPELLSTVAEKVKKELSKVLPNYKGQAGRILKETYSAYLEQLTQGIWARGMEQFSTYLYPHGEGLAGYLPRKGLVVLQEPDLIRENYKKIEQEMNSWYYDLLAEGKILPSFAQNFIRFDEFQKMVAGQPFLLLAHLPETAGFLVANQHKLLTRDTLSYKGRLQQLAEDLRYYKKEKYQIMMSAGSQIRREKLQGLLQEMDLLGIEIVDGAFSRGFDCPPLRLLLLGETDVLGQNIHAKPRRPMRKGEKINTFLDLKVEDYVVHVNHGIGRYLGVVSLEVEGHRRDYLHLQYAGGDKLYVPTEQVDLIQKYVGGESQAPKVYKLGGTEWHRVKAKVRSSVQDMAKELLALYAAREALKGHAFSVDTPWQKEFEDAFPYLETFDQLRSVEEIKKDMENIKPMDRLLCGDVGYGKTEVALRAAFKAVMDGKQVAVLVPTTVLAQQHQRTFAERFSELPVTIDVLSRFRSPKEIKTTLKSLSQGRVDIVIGTHRLLSQDIKFKDLGLLIVDEEQRFGVSHKEKIKRLKQNVDVLTLTATPIPRTLHMSLVGVRDMSLIETPPEDRQPVQTFVMEYQDRVIKEAISRELNRGGQVYFVHNQVKNIFAMAKEIQDLVPEANIIVGHGQMKEHELEQVMLDFVAGDYNVLVCTTIVESGLDIPNVNTLIVNEADKLGLSQLYQLRGRVGRSEKQAYAYFTYRRERILSGIAKKRLTAIRDFTELGSGFKIAMRDLEIRGAGNILGPEQHGHILAVGFDMYCRLVEEEVRKQQQKDERPKEKVVPLLEINTNAYLSDEYIKATDLKIEVYKRLAAAEDLTDVQELAYEVEDRFGVMGEAANNLFALGELKVLAQNLQVQGIIQQSKVIVIRFSPQHQIIGNDLGEIVSKFGRRISFGVSGDLEIRLNIDGLSTEKWLSLIIQILKNLNQEVKSDID